MNRPSPLSTADLESSESSAVAQDSIASPVDATPESFKSFDVAQFLEEEDAAEFESAYGVRPDMDADGDTNIGRGRSNLGAFHDTPVETDEAIEESVASDDAEDEDAVVEDVVVDPTPKKRPPRRSIDHSEYKRKPKRSISLPSFGPPDWKLVGAIALVVAVSGIFVWQAYRLNRGQTVEVREGLD